MPLFGRKKAAPSPSPSTPGPERGGPGHENVLRHLRALDATDPQQRLQLGGMIVFDLIYYMVAEAEKGARIEEILAILGSVGGYSCIVGVLDGLARDGAVPTGHQLVVIAVPTAIDIISATFRTKRFSKATCRCSA